MGRIVFDTATTINGWIADENNSLGWLFAVTDGEAPADGLEPPDAPVVVMGSTTYLWVLEAEGMLANPAKWQEAFGNKSVFVFTTQQLDVPDGANVSLVDGEVTATLPRLREAAADGDIWIVGGGDLVGQFADAGALDEIALSVAPVALNGGAPLLPRRIESDRLTLTAARQVGQFARLIYAVGPSR